MARNASRPRPPALVAGVRDAVRLDGDGTVERLALADAARAGEEQPVVCHRVATAGRLGVAPFATAHDVLELFAFVRPAHFCPPTPRGLAAALDLPPPPDLESEAAVLHQAARALLDAMRYWSPDAVAPARATAWRMARAGWPWGAPVLSMLGIQSNAGDGDGGRLDDGLRVWLELPEWEELPPEPPAAGSDPVPEDEARRRLSHILGPRAETRDAQADYAAAATHAFAPREQAGHPHMVLAEAGTGIGKTLAYVAPAAAWAEHNQAPVWLSTYTRTLQRQLDNELDRLVAAGQAERDTIVVRKGRENYLCLLNLEEAVQSLANRNTDVVALGLMARWARRTRDGDMVGGDFPSWLTELFGRTRTLGLADRRGECVFTACPHYQKCFIERTIRRARRARMVVANHALVMVQAALGGLDDGTQPTRYVFDEGHHLFDAADSAFSAELSGLEAGDLRRWLLGAEAMRGSRARGLKIRLEGLADLSDAVGRALTQALAAARALPAPGWRQRLTEGQPAGAVEQFLAKVRQQVYARNADTDTPYSLEAVVGPPVEGLPEAAEAAEEALDGLLRPLTGLAGALEALLEDEAQELDTADRTRIEGLVRSLERRAVVPVRGWLAMLQALAAGTPPEYVDWFSVQRHQGQDMDVAMTRAWIDPTRPFADQVATRAHGLLVTSATLRDGSGDESADWRAAEERTGAVHLPEAPHRVAFPSPFDYAGRTRVLVVTDVRKDTLDQVAAAYRELFTASNGGALGLFTAIARLRGVHQRIAAPLEDAGLPLLAQHVDAMDPATLVDVFRAEADACLLGTDAMRDGVDVPGHALRCIVFDRVPWPRPDILHRARRDAFGGRRYDDMLTRLRLKQAFGRLVRRADDAGVFVLLDPMMPSRLSGAFPPGVQVERVGLKEACAITRQTMERFAPDGRQ